MRELAQSAEAAAQLVGEQLKQLRQRQRDVAQERAVVEQAPPMFELDNRKDHILSVCKVATANLAMHVRDRYFPPNFTQATWLRLRPFFELPGRIQRVGSETIVELQPFHDRQLNRDLAALCAKVAEHLPRLPDGSRLRFVLTHDRCPALLRC